MYVEHKRTHEKKSMVSRFTVLFWDDFVKLDDTILPVGQCVTDLLNVEDDTLLAMREAYVDFAKTFGERLCNDEVQTNLALVTEVQQKMNVVWDAIFELPPYRYLKLDKESSRQMLITAYEQFPAEFAKMVVPYTDENVMITELLFKLQRIFPDAVSFKSYISVLLELFYERLRTRSAENYAVGVYSLLSDTTLMNEIAESLPPHPDMMFRQTSEATIEYTPMRHPVDEKKYVIAERLAFENLGDFLRADFFRGIMRGNAPRKCHNCGRYFLLTSGYDIRYCTNIAPSETKRTCRQVGPHKKEQRHEGETPIWREYRRAYNRLKTRRARGKVTPDEWNRLVAEAQELRDRAVRGEVPEFEAVRMFVGM